MSKISLGFFILFFTPSLFAQPLLRISRQTGSLHESFTLTKISEGEELETNTNYLNPSALEFGRYSRGNTGLAERLQGLQTKTPEKSGLKAKKAVTNLLGWDLEILGQKVPASDPRYEKAFSLFNKEANAKSWKAEDVYSFRLDFPRLISSHYLRAEKHPRLEEFKALQICKNVVETKLFCRLDKGAIYLPQKAKK